MKEKEKVKDIKLEEVKKALKKYFGYDSFRPGQEQVIEAVMKGQDNLVIMPTGGGKSLCFQLPAIVMDGVCVVVSPLIALMKDQVEGLKENGVKAGFINSSLDQQEQAEVAGQAQRGDLQLLYVSPERLLTENFLQFLDSLPVNLFAIDEAHCISSWGHDFRPEYTQLRLLKERYPGTPVIALTATADRVTRNDIVAQLHLADPQIYIASFDRPNLSLEVRPGQKRIEQILEFVRGRKGESGIIYCLSRKSTESVAAKLNGAGFKANHYHAGMNPEERSSVQEAFIKDEIPIIVATIAFGMGIDKSNVRWIIHYNMPKNVEGYYQEIGRAGRDGLPSSTVLFYSFGDVIQLRKMLEEGENSEIQLAKLERMMQLADARICRRKILLNYFGEHLEENCQNCDVCKNPPQLVEGTVLAQKALSAISRMEEKVGIGLVIDVLRGSARQEVLRRGYDKIRTYGIGADVSYPDWQQFFLQFLHMGLIEIAYDEGGAVKLTPEANRVLFEGKKVSLVALQELRRKKESKAAAKPAKSKKELFREELFEKLRTLRKKLASKAGVPPYLVFHDTALVEMSNDLPTTEGQMRKISGVGDRKYRMYGDIFINEILQYVQSNMKQEKPVKVKGGTYLQTLGMLKEGKSVAEIAQERELNEVTVYSHISYLYENGHPVELNRYVSETEVQQVKNAVDATGVSDKLKELYEFLNEEMPYHKIKMGLSWLKAEGQIGEK